MKKIIIVVLSIFIYSGLWAGWVKCPNCETTIGYIRDTPKVNWSESAKKMFKEKARQAALATDIELFGDELELRLKEVLNEIEVILWKNNK